MKRNRILPTASLLSIILMTFHLTGDIQLGMEPRGLRNMIGVLILVLWLCGPLVLAERRSGHVIMLTGGLFASAMPVIHMSGDGIIKSGGAFYVWTLLALGVIGIFSFIISAQGLWSMRRGPSR